MNHDFEPTLSEAQKHYAAGRFDEAARLLQGVLASAPDHGEAHAGLGFIAARQGDHARAAEHLVAASTRIPMPVDDLNFAAQVCQSAQRHDDAIALFERCLAQFPNHIASLHGVAMSLVQAGNLPRALEKLEQLCKLQPQSAEAHYNRGNLLGQMERFDDERMAYEYAIKLKPRFVPAYTNLGVVLRDLGRFDDAMLQFKKALAIDPNDAGARTNRAQTNLLRGEFEHGWREYEWRWRDGTMSHGLPDSTQWTGTQPVAGKTVFVHQEQGFGDTLQFVRFVDRLTESGARVVLRVQNALLPLLQHYRGAAEVIGERAPVPAFDFHIPLLSLPLALKLREADFAATGPYLHAPESLVAQWDDLFAGATERPRVGLVWSGSRMLLNDRNRNRAIALEQLQPLLDAQADFVSLQHDVRESDRAYLTELEARGVLRDVSSRLATFADTAALISRLDLVIGVDTAVAHLAGALGKPVWIALPFMPDWRWQLNRSDSPWYATARLFRQTARGDWASVIAALRAQLDAGTPHAQATKPAR
ncbi:tetratricopeptide repeat protein [Paraburkholderia edwinii]|uniref:Tetratricopeptide repeat protein n=1 Tax=Paraburkholderia edwinii TaxID=2861782 RepID=A0ABX8US06_9BURK|nr:tetratricopeptide repeat protein [Paraburkholderia edwinii]QYD69774.1 tetratricopeptide repeat protein [Paraburkholderia edwinii]